MHDDDNIMTVQTHIQKKNPNYLFYARAFVRFMCIEMANKKIHGVVYKTNTSDQRECILFNSNIH